MLDKISKTPPVDFVVLLLKYFHLRLRQVWIFTAGAFETFIDHSDFVKKYVTSRMFWGRGSFYKNSFHLLVTVASALLLVTGLVSRLGDGLETAALEVDYGAIGNNDLLEQGSSLTAVLAVDDSAQNYKVFTHDVKSGQTIESIAESYQIDVDTVVWANSRIINPLSPSVSAGMELQIPEIDGVLYTVRAGDTLDSVIANAKGGDRFSIIELNNLVPPDYRLEEGQKIFIPSGELPPPALPSLSQSYFADPLSHPQCNGYRYVRGWIPGFHSGVDLSIGGGCPIRAIAGGVVIHSGWYGLGGYSVIVDHGNGIESYYYHGNGTIWVREGDYVNQGDDLLYMGNSGNSRGTHLHLTLKRNGVEVNPDYYVPYRR